MDLDASIRQAIQTGRVEIGLDTVTKAAITGRARLIIVSEKCPPDSLDDLSRYTELSGIPLIRYRGNSADLGRVCRKPFQVASLAVIDPGDSSIMSAAKGI
jgi:large subunit ribosomal protein L30e